MFQMFEDLLKGLKLKSTETSSSTAATGPKPLSINCNKCHKNINVHTMAAAAVLCDRSKCYIKKPEAKQRAADLLGIEPRDMIPVTTGTLAPYSEEFNATNHSPIFTD